MPSINVRGRTPPQDHGHTTAGDGGTLGSGVVDTSQLADDALSADAAGRAKMTDGFLQDAKVNATANIAQSKLSLAITDSEVAVGANISKDKLAALARTGMYHGDEIEVSVTGTTEEQVKDLAIIRDATNALELKTLKIVARMKSSLGTATASLKVYHDGGATPDLTLTSVSTTYEEKSGTIDVSGWTTGRHTIEIKLVSDTAGETAYDELLEIYGVQ